MGRIDIKFLPSERHFICCTEKGCDKPGAPEAEKCYCPCHDVPCGICGRPRSWHREGLFCAEKNRRREGAEKA